MPETPKNNVINLAEEKELRELQKEHKRLISELKEYGDVLKDAGKKDEKDVS